MAELPCHLGFDRCADRGLDRDRRFDLGLDLDRDLDLKGAN